MTAAGRRRPAAVPVLWSVLVVCAPCALEAAAAGRGIPSFATEPGHHALLVGIDAFEDPAFEDLQWAEADAQGMDTALTDVGFDSTTTITTGGPSSRAGLLAELEAFLAPRGPDDTVLVYLSTHGVVDYVGGPPRRFLVARDTRRDDLRNTGIDVRELIRIVEASAPRWKVIVLATCFGGTGAGVKSAEGPMPDHRRGRPELPPMPLGARRATVVLSASYEDGPAWEDPTLGHEIYTHYLLDALSRAADGEVDLDGDGALSAFEAHGYATGRTIDHTGGRQLPSADLNAVGERDVVLTAEAPQEASRGVFWLLPDWLRPRGDEGPRAWIDEEPVDASAPGQPLEAGSHRLRLHWPDGSQPDRDLAFRVGLGDDLSVGDVLARAEDQWLGLEAGVVLVGGAAAYNRTNDDPNDATDDPHDLPLAVPALRLVFEQRLAGRAQPRGLDLGLSLAYWPGKVYDEPLGHLPAHYAALDVALLASRRRARLSLAGGPYLELAYLRAAGSEASTLAVAPGLRLRLHVRLGRRLSLRVAGQLSVARMDPLAGLNEPSFVPLPSLSVGLGAEL
jgi:hypothetical protein